MIGKVFKAYDVRGTYPSPLDENMAWQIGFGCGTFLLADAEAAGHTSPMMRTIVVGRDMRKSSPDLRDALCAGIADSGANVIDIGMVDTPQVYFAINHLDCAGGVQVTASHNPPQYNGFKVSKRKAKPVGADTGLDEIRRIAATVDERQAKGKREPRIEQRDLWDAYRQHVRAFLPPLQRKLKIVVDASNAMAGTMVPAVFGPKGNDVENLEIVQMYFDNTSGEFTHEPNPLVPANLADLQQRVTKEKADLGVCFDGDADRLIVVDETANIVGCDHLTALLAIRFLRENPGAPVVYDLRSSKATEETIREAGGQPLRSRVGHVFMKQALSDRGAVFGGELSGHFYFKDNFDADSGAIALAAVLAEMNESDTPLSQRIAPIARYTQSGEINFQTEEKDEALAMVKESYADRGTIDELDGVTVDCFDAEGWWANVRKSNTEPLLRLNLEARDPQTMERIVDEITPLLGERAPH